MKPIENVRQMQQPQNKFEIVVGELEDNELVITYNGETQHAPILGLFTIDAKYYITLLVKEDNKEAVVIYRVIRNDDGTECIQVIESKEEWDLVSAAWSDILDTANNKL